MTEHQPYGTRLRRHRLGPHDDGRLMIVPLDHSVADGPLSVQGSLDTLVGELADADVDAVVLHKGSVRHVAPERFARTSLIVHLSASTSRAPDPDAKYLVAGVESAMRLGADAVSVHVNMGSQEESQQVADLAEVVESCDRWSVPLLAMMYARGPRIDHPADPELLAHAAGIAADLGADIVKIARPTAAGALADIVSGCPIPVVVAGGPPVEIDELLADTRAAVAEGAAGVAMGRNVFQAPEPSAMARRVVEAVHPRARLGALTGMTRIG